MRIFCIISILLLFYACDNDITTLGNNLISNENYIEVKRFVIDETSTIKLDSFPTSSIFSASNTTGPTLVLGKIEDQVTGTVTAIPYFQVAPQGVPNITIANNSIFDSVILNLPYTKILAGDTTSFQTFEVYQTKEYINFDRYNPILCDTDSLPLGKKLSTLVLYPQKDNINKAYFKLDYEFGKKIFDRIISRDHIFDPENYIQFMEDYNALALVPGRDNSNLMSINSSGLKLTFHYHIGSYETESFTWPLATPLNTYTPAMNNYAFTNIRYKPKSNFENVSFTNPMPFKEHNMAVVEGLTGLMTKLKVPFIANTTNDQTIVKAEIELRVNTDYLERNILEPRDLYVYVVTKDNYILYDASSSTTNPIVGRLSQNSADPNSRSYFIDITDFYISRVEGVQPINPEIYMLIGLWGGHVNLSGTPSSQLFVGDVSNTYERVIFKEEPILSIYYSHYNK